jgi:hypothetical protein
MAGKHRKVSRRRPRAITRWVPGLTAAAVSATSLTTALSTGAATSTPVQLVALITPANSTSQIFAGTTYYGTNYSTTYGPQQVVPFLLGPQGIVNAIDRNGNDPNIVVLSSGWGAGQTATALALMQANDDPAMKNLKLVILDNNTNRAGGGFWTTYYPFAPLLLTSAKPTPSDTIAPIVDVSYEYNVNSDAVTYPINVVSDLNSLVAYAYGYGAQATAPVPPVALDPVAPGAQHYHYVVAPDGTVAQTIPVNGNITYVTFQSNGLPLVRPLKMLPGGSILADALTPTLTELVNAGYQDNQPIPDDPGVTRPMGLLPPASQSAATPALKLTAPLAEEVDMAGGNKSVPGATHDGATSPGHANPLKQVVGNISSTLGDLAKGLKKSESKTTSSTTSGPSS